jgi:glucokinase
MKQSALGVDLGGTKIEVALVDHRGRIRAERRLATDVDGGPEGVCAQIVEAIRSFGHSVAEVPVGVGIAGQVTGGSGLVRFAPNLGWRDVPLKERLEERLALEVTVTNDVRAATWGEWLHGAGLGCDELVCVFVGTGIGGGVVVGGRLLAGATNSAGEVGHMTVNLSGPACTCGNHGCLEAYAGGWAIARRAREAVAGDPQRGQRLVSLAGGRVGDLTAREVAQAYAEGEPLARELVRHTAEALAAGAASIVNAFNPARLIFGGGVFEGLPDLLELVRSGLCTRALAATTGSLEVLPAALGNKAGVIGAASLALRSRLSVERRAGPVPPRRRLTSR